MPGRILQVNAQPYSRLGVDDAQLERLFSVLEGSTPWQAPGGELSVVFLTDEALAQIHGQFLNDPSSTDVITFSGDDEMDFAGEICVSVDRAMAEAPRHNWSFAEELTLYLIHGWLHLAGLDDLDDAGRLAMRAAEQHCIDALRQAGAIPEFVVR